MSRRVRALGWTAVGLLVGVSLFLGRGGPPRERRGSLPLRLLGPISSAAAGVQWVRVHAALRASRTDLALARGSLALELDPGATGGWLMLAGHLAFDRASTEREPSPQRRLAWVRAGLALAARGEEQARDPARLALWQGLVLGKLAQEDEPLPWPGGVRGLWLDAAGHFDRAAALGAADGEALATSARERAREAALGEPGR